MTDTLTTVSRIRDLNDAFRRGAPLGPGDCYITRGVERRGPAFVTQALTAVRDFDAFTPDSDPFGEHDFGVVHVEDETVFWKIDYYDRDDADTGADDPADPQTTRRILTILLASEY